MARRYCGVFVKTGNVELEKQQLLENGSETTFFLGNVHKQATARRPLLGSRFLVSKNISPLLGNGSVSRFLRKRLAYENEQCFLRRPCRVIIRKATGATELVEFCTEVRRKESVTVSCQLKVRLSRENKEVGVKWPPAWELVS
jgi:hypothetical protein